MGGHKRRNSGKTAKHKAEASSLDPPLSNCNGGNLEISENNHKQGLECSKAGEEGGKQLVLLEGMETSLFDLAAVNADCDKAFKAFKTGNHSKSLRVMKDAISRNSSCAVLYRVQGSILMKMAALIEDPNGKQRHLKSAIESAKKAVSLAPRSIEYAHFYAQLLFDAATDSNGYDVVIQQCEKALNIENPMDPAKDILQDDSQQKNLTPQERINNLQNELKSLMQRCNIASLSTWMKHLGNGGPGEEKFRFIPMRRAPEDPLESRMLQNKRPNEIRRNTKTQEERRKEIEVRVAAQRLAQQSKENQAALCLESDNANQAMTPAPNNRDRRKPAASRRVSHVALPEEKMEQVRPYWHALDAAQRQKLLEVQVEDLKTHIVSMKDNVASEILDDCLSFAKNHGMWKFWVCYRCEEKFSSSEAHIQHVTQNHMEKLSEKLQAAVPPGIDEHLAKQLTSEDARPIDALEALKTLIGMSEASKKEDVTMLTNGDVEHSILIVPDESLSEELADKRSSFTQAGESNGGDFELFDLNQMDVASKDNHSYSKGSTDVRVVYQCSLDESSVESWPLSDDNERSKLLERLYGLLQILVSHKCLAAAHLSKVLQFTADQLQSVFSEDLPPFEIKPSPIYLRFLNGAQIREIIKYLRDLIHACGLERYLDRTSTPMEAIEEDNSISEPLLLDENSGSLVLDGRLLGGKNDGTITENKGNSPISLKDFSIKEWQEKLSPSELQLAWVYGNTPYECDPQQWVQTRKENSQKGMETIHTLNKEFYTLQGLCERKLEHQKYDEALIAIERFCLEETKLKEHSLVAGKFYSKSYGALLRRREEELVDLHDDFDFVQRKFELEAITNILKEAQDLPRFRFDDAFSPVSRLNDFDEEDEWRAHEIFHPSDSNIEIAFQKQKEQISTEISKLDARLMKLLSDIQELECELSNVSYADYQCVLLPLVKSFLKSRVQEAAEKDATEKSNAAREAFLAELELAEKKNAEKALNAARNPQEKSKDKKKNKDLRRSKDTKGQVARQGSISSCENEEDISEIQNHAMEYSDKYHYQEVKWQVDDEDAEKKLAETLALQRKIEEEAKQKHLAELSKRNSEENQWSRSKESQKKLSNGSCQYTAGTDGVQPDLNGSTEQSLFKDDEIVTLGHKIAYVVNHPQRGATQFARKDTHSEDQSRNLNKNSSGKDRYNMFTHGSHNRHTGKINSQNEQVRTEESKLQKNLQSDHKMMLEPANVLSNRSTSDKITTVSGEGSSKTLRQLRAEEDEEERFKADIEKAVRQSMDTFNAEKTPYLLSKNVEIESRVVVTKPEVDNIGRGLQNDVGEYNCFLNVIIQSLWHLKRFREGFLARAKSPHTHVGDPCVVCALYNIFVALSSPTEKARKEVVAPTSLRIALSTLYPKVNLFQQAQMNDASEVLGEIFDCLHKAFMPSNMISEKKCDGDGGIGSWDCQNKSCIVHSIFGLDISEQMNCQYCRLESRHLKYTSFFHNINANALRTMKIMCTDSSLDELLKLVEMNHQLACDSETGGCGRHNYIHHFLSESPHVFTTVLGWQNNHENVEDISATLEAITTELDVAVIYRGLDEGCRHRLISVVCYYGQHYHCFAYRPESAKWIMYDDTAVKVVGGWEEVTETCRKGHLQPQVLFYEAME